MFKNKGLIICMPYLQNTKITLSERQLKNQTVYSAYFTYLFIFILHTLKHNQGYFSLGLCLELKMITQYFENQWSWNSEIYTHDISLEIWKTCISKHIHLPIEYSSTDGHQVRKYTEVGHVWGPWLYVQET